MSGGPTVRRVLLGFLAVVQVEGPTLGGGMRDPPAASASGKLPTWWTDIESRIFLCGKRM